MDKCITPTEYFHTLKQVSCNVNKDDGTIKAKEKLGWWHVVELEKEFRKHKKSSKEGEIDKKKHDGELNEDHVKG